MPAAFDDCVRRGGRVRTKTLSGGRYLHFCYIDGKSYAGEVKVKQAGDEAPKRKRRRKGAF